MQSLHRMRVNPIALCLAFALAYPTGSAWAQTSSSSETQSTWRATSRLGYGPNAAIAQAALSDPKAWALLQIDAAYDASKRPPHIPAEYARIGVPVNDLVRDFHAEREARKNMRQAEAKPAMAAASAVAAPAVMQDPENFSRDMQQSAAAWRLTACSNPGIENPLLARMTEFWFNHLNVFVGKGPVRPFVGNYAVHVIRANALGKFEDLLMASAKHPAMLFYLDQAQSNSRGLNENYARELMELHTLGVNSGYTQNDVRELARILTGWTVDIPAGESFKFAERLHDKGSKTLLGVQYNNKGLAEGEEAIRFLAHQPATAQRISARLASFFVADKPSQVLVDSLSKTFLSTQGDIRAVMRVLVESPEFWASSNQLFKTPMDFACSTLTAAGGIKDKRDLNQSLGFLNQAGQGIHGWQTPDGYKTDAATWLAPEALTRRADYVLGMASRMAEPLYLLPFLSSTTRDRVAIEAPQMRTGLMLASPDFMNK